MFDQLQFIRHPQLTTVSLSRLLKFSFSFGGFGALGKLIINIANKCNTQEQADKVEYNTRSKLLFSQY